MAHHALLLAALEDMTYIIVVDNLTKSYGSNTAVKHFNLTVNEGEVVALWGPQGSGKSTILKVISADLKPDEGFVYVCNYDTVLKAGLVRPLIGVVRHERFLDGGLTGRENLDEQAMLRFFTPEEAEQRIGELLPLIDLGALIDAHARTYTPDEWMRAELAACLIHRPRVLLVDEPTRGCDAAGREKVWSALHKLRPQVSSVLFTTPDADEAKALSDRIIEL
jgi:ABC-2 type transport system ATP-binding protein